jgi:hypothetical protein
MHLEKQFCGFLFEAQTLSLLVFLFRVRINSAVTYNSHPTAQNIELNCICVLCLRVNSVIFYRVPAVGAVRDF